MNNNKIIISAGIGLLGINMLNGEMTAEHTKWIGTHLNYQGVSIINRPALPQEGVEIKKGEKNAYNVMPGMVTVITSLSKRPQEKQEWLYKKICKVILGMTGNIYVGFESANTTNGLVFNSNPNNYGKSGTLYSVVYITAMHQVTKVQNDQDLGVSGKDEDPSFTLVKEI